MSIKIYSMYDGAYNSSVRRLLSANVEHQSYVKQLSSGIRINSAADDVAGLSLVTKLNTKLMANSVAKSNTQTGLNMINTADGALSGMVDSLQRMRNLALQSANGVYDSGERAMLQQEINKLSSGIKQAYQSASFGDKNLFGATACGTNEVSKISEAEAIKMGYTEARIIRSAADFKNKITASLNGSFILVNDIDMSELGTLNNSVITSIFNGILDGNGCSVKNLSIDTGAAVGNDIALFRQLSGQVKNLSIENASINAINMGHVGILAGRSNPGAMISNCYVSGTIKTTGNYSGGLVGRATTATISNCSADINIQGGLASGGLVGQLQGGTLKSCVSSGLLNATASAGGLIGGIQLNASVLNSTSSVNVTGTGSVGGFAGGLAQGIVLGCSSSGTVNSTGASAGGFVGWNEALGIISNSYSTSSVTSSAIYTGGFVGRNQGKVANSYSTGGVAGTSQVGGFAGYSNNNITASYSTSSVQGTAQMGGFVGVVAGGIDYSSCFYENNFVTTAGNAINGNVATLPINNWDGGVWDLSGDLPALAGAQKAVGSATTLCGLQVGTEADRDSRISINTAFGLGDMRFDVSSQSFSLKSVDKIDALMNVLNGIRADVGAQAGKLTSILDNQDDRHMGYSGAKSNIMDTDMASAQAGLVRSEVLKNFAVGVFSQAKSINKNLVLNLLSP